MADRYIHRTRRIVRLRRWLCIGLAACAFASPAQDSFPSLHARPVDLCADTPACEHVGRIRLLGALQLADPVVNLVNPVVNEMRVSQLSGLAWDEDDDVLYALSDKGYFFGLRPVLKNDRLVDVTLVSAARLIDPKTHKTVRYRRSDSEGLDIRNGHNGRHGDAELLVSYEGEPRIVWHRRDGSVLSEVPLAAPLNQIHQYRYNRMLEGACVHPTEGILTAPEEPMLIDNGATRLYRTDGRSWLLPRARGGITELKCLPDGDVLVLEREFSPVNMHFVSSLLRVHLPPNTPTDTTLKAETLFVLDTNQGWKIDNFEGLAHHRGNRFFMVSDNNDFLLQRTLLVYFEILDTP